MKALVYRKSIPRYLSLSLLGRVWRGAANSPLSVVSCRDVDPPPLPTKQWVRVRPRLSGICGSDIATIRASGSPYFSALTSTPFVMGHEVVGTITEIGDDAESWKEGDRAVLQPALGCLARQIDPPCERCAEGRLGLCVNVTKGCVGPGIQTGFARDTGGGWSESFIAHRSQLHRVPDSLDDATAVLAEPYACAIHASMLLEKLANSIKTIFVVGCGAIGLLTIAALRAAGGDRRIVAAARYPHQRELAREFGADDVLPAPRSVQEQYPLWSETLGAELHKAEIGKPVVMGGADATLDCVGSSRSIDDALRFTRSGGAVVLVGMPAIPKGVDWTSIWHKELTIKGAYAYGVEDSPSRTATTFELALEGAAKIADRLRLLATRTFPLRDFKLAFGEAMNVGRSRSVKTLFRIDEGSSSG